MILTANAKAILKDFRWLRILHYDLNFCLGMALAILNEQPFAGPLIFLRQVLLIFFGILSAALFCIINNNIADITIDTIASPHRPLITGECQLLLYKRIGVCAAGISLLFGFISHLSMGIGLILIMAIYYFYSTPPIRFKQFLLFSKLSVGMNSLIVLLMGYFLYGHQFAHLPLIVFPIYLIGVTLAANVIDIKDSEGDLKGGIKTLANTWDMRLTMFTINCGFLLAYVGFYFLGSHQNGLLWLAIIFFSIGQFFLLGQKPYNEKSILLFYLIALSSGITYLLV